MMAHVQAWQTTGNLCSLPSSIKGLLPREGLALPPDFDSFLDVLLEKGAAGSAGQFPRRAAVLS
ncbi:MAG: hypothetical protein ACRERY_02710 [Pseudomonas sp.]